MLLHQLLSFFQEIFQKSQSIIHDQNIFDETNSSKFRYRKIN